MGSTFIWIVSIIAIIFFVVLLPFALRPRKRFEHEHPHDAHVDDLFVTFTAKICDKWEHTDSSSQFKFPSQLLEYIVEFRRDNGKTLTLPVSANDYVSMTVGQEKYLTVRDGVFFRFSDTPPTEEEMDEAHGTFDSHYHPDAVFGEEPEQEREKETV